MHDILFFLSFVVIICVAAFDFLVFPIVISILAVESATFVDCERNSIKMNC